MATQQFQYLFCQRFGCQPSEYEARAFKECLYWHARFLAPIVRRVKPDFFEEDSRLVSHLGRATSLPEVDGEIQRFRHAGGKELSFWRMTLRLRVSSRKASRLAHELLAAELQAGD